MAANLPTEEQLVKEFGSIRKKLEQQLTNLQKIRPNIIKDLRQLAIEVDRKSVDSLWVLAAKFGVLSVAGAFALPFLTAAAGITVFLGAEQGYKAYEKSSVKSAAKHQIIEHQEEHKLLSDILNEWTQLSEQLKVIYPQTDSELMGTVLVLLTEEDGLAKTFNVSDASVILEKVNDIMNNFATKSSDLGKVIWKTWGINICDVATEILKSLSDICKTLYQDIKILLEGKTPTDSETLRKLADKIEEAYEKEEKLYQLITEFPSAADIYKEKGLTYIIDKSNRFRWFLVWDENLKDFYAVLNFDKKNTYALKSEEGKRKLCPVDAQIKRNPVQDLEITDEKQKESAKSLANFILDFGKISPSKSQLIRLLKFAQNEDRKLNYDGLTDVIKEFRNACEGEETFADDMILSCIKN